MYFGKTAYFVLFKRDFLLAMYFLSHWVFTFYLCTTTHLETLGSKIAVSCWFPYFGQRKMVFTNQNCWYWFRQCVLSHDIVTRMFWRCMDISHENRWEKSVTVIWSLKIIIYVILIENFDVVFFFHKKLKINQKNRCLTCKVIIVIQL